MIHKEGKCHSLKSKPHVSFSDIAFPIKHVDTAVVMKPAVNSRGHMGRKQCDPLCLCHPPPPLYTHTRTHSLSTLSPSPHCMPLSLSGWVLLEPAFSSSHRTHMHDMFAHAHTSQRCQCQNSSECQLSVCVCAWLVYNLVRPCMLTGELYLGMESYASF